MTSAAERSAPDRSCLREWKRGSRIILDANPGYRQARFPASDDPARAALVKSMHGKTLPAVGVVEVNIIDEELTRLLQFEQGGIDYLALRGEIASRLLANGKLKPEYVGARRDAPRASRALSVLVQLQHCRSASSAA